MKTSTIIASTAVLLLLAACAKRDGSADTAGAQATANFAEFGNDAGFAADNVIVPENDAAEPNASDTNASDASASDTGRAAASNTD